MEISDYMVKYFDKIHEQVDNCYKIAQKARSKGYDPELFVESPQAKDLAGRVEKLIGPEGVGSNIRDLKKKGLSDDEIVFKIVSDILDKKIGNIEDIELRVERAIRVGLAIKTMGVVSAPLEGISKIQIRTDPQGNKYLSLYFAGPIRAAGGTTAALCVLIADFVRNKASIPKYKATEAEIGRNVEEVKLYDRRVHLQYPSSHEEIRFAIEHLPVEINGDATELEEVSAFRDLPRIETNNIRGGACLVLNDGIILKAPKLHKIAQTMNLTDWDWLIELKKIGDSHKKTLKNESTPSIHLDAKKITPNSKYVADIIAGRPVFSHPSRIGGHRIRYGRSRNTGLAAVGMHPATMTLLDSFIAIGTQLRIERPGKSASVCPVDSIEPPIVKLTSGDVVRVSNSTIAMNVYERAQRILFLGDILIGFGEFAENNHKLVPSGYVPEWWALELEKNLNDLGISENKLQIYIDDPINNTPTAEIAIELARKFHVPLHPDYTDYWGNLNIEEVQLIRKAFLESYNPQEKYIELPNNASLKVLLEKAFILHNIEGDFIKFSDQMNTIYITIFNLNNHNDLPFKEAENVFDYFFKCSSIVIKNKAPYYMGTRMGRPEKSERKSMKGVHTLFPLSDKVGNSRLVEKAMELGKVKIDVCRKECPKCGNVNIFNTCIKCGTHTETRSVCEKCKTLYNPMNLNDRNICSKCGNLIKSSGEALFNFRNHVSNKLTGLKLNLPEKMKGIFGLTNQFKVPEPIEKGILRAKNHVLVYKTAEIRYDATDIPLTHFKPKEIGCSVEKLIALGYERDYKRNPILNKEQIIELKVQDILLSEDCANYLIKVASFIDDELELFYHMNRFYNVNSKEDLIGHLVVGLAPHTSAGIIGRIIGFSPARSIYAHPFWHAAKRRNCDGDEDGVMLLLDPLLNFSRYYLPSKIGGRMDATLVISSKLDPNEVDVEAHNIDTLYRYPLEFYQATESYATPGEIEDIMQLVSSKLGTQNQYENIGYNIPTMDINEGPKTTSYKTYGSMDEKVEAQLTIAKIIDAVDEKAVAEKILVTHFNPDILGNLRKFSVQTFRCVKCNTKYRRPPISNSGKCPNCGNKVILTVNKGSIEKYIPRALKMTSDFDLDQYTVQRMTLVKEYIESLTNNPKIKQQHLSEFF